MRSLANAPTPTWRPSISTVSVPSGDAAVTVPEQPGRSDDSETGDGDASFTRGAGGHQTLPATRS